MTDRRPLTARQAEIYYFIDREITDTGASPTIREIAGHIGVRSSNAVSDHLKALEKKGWIRREPFVPRGIRLIEGGLMPEQPAVTANKPGATVREIATRAAMDHPEWREWTAEQIEDIAYGYRCGYQAVDDEAVCAEAMEADAARLAALSRLPPGMRLIPETCEGCGKAEVEARIDIPAGLAHRQCTFYRGCTVWNNQDGWAPGACTEHTAASTVEEWVKRHTEGE